MDTALETALKEALAAAEEQRAEAFTALRRAVREPPQLSAWHAKAELLLFLAALYQQKRLYHRQVLSFLELILQQPGYLPVAETLRPSWPEEMCKVAEDVAGQAEPTTGGYGTAEAPEAPVMRHRSMEDTLAMLDDALKRLKAAKYSFTVLTGSGLEEDDLLQSFEAFRRAVCRVTQDARIEKNVLDKIEPKESIMGFLLEVVEKKPRQKKRIESLMMLLMKLDTWRTVAEGEALRVATAQFREPQEKEEEVQKVKTLEVDIDALVEDAERRGVYALLLVRVIAAQNLINSDWWSLSDPYTKVTVDGVARSTAVVDDCLDPHWDEELWCFDVKAESSILRLEVWDKDAVQDDSLGYVSIPVTMLPGELTASRFGLDQVEHGELEVELRFLRLEAVDLLRSGGPSRKLPGPSC